MSNFSERERDQMLNCMRCGLCLPTCPTYQLTGRERSSPRGRIALMRAVDEGELPLEAPNFGAEMDFCLGCMACVTACPAGVEYGALLEAARDQVAASRRLPWWQRLVVEAAFSLFADLRRLRLLARLLRLYQKSGLERLVRATGLLALLPWHLGDLSDLLPPIPERFSSERLPARGPGAGRPVGLLLGCVMDVLMAEENLATARVLERNGWRVLAPPEQGCCGALHAHAGRLEEARQLARSTIAAFGEAEVVAVNSAGCGACMKHYGSLLADDPEWAERARAFSAKVKDVHELLAEEGWERPASTPYGRATYHDACHLAHGQGVRQAPREMVASVAVEYSELPRADRCCGSAGVYNLTHYETAMQLLDEKLEDLEATGAAVVGVANPGCLLQIRCGLRRRGSPVRAEHPMVMLDRAYAEAGPDTGSGSSR